MRTQNAARGGSGHRGRRRTCAGHPGPVVVRRRQRPVRQHVEQEGPRRGRRARRRPRLRRTTTPPPSARAPATRSTASTARPARGARSTSPTSAPTADCRSYGGDFVLAVNDSGKVTGSSQHQERVIDLALAAADREGGSRAAHRRALVDTVTEASTPTLAVYAQGAPRLAWLTHVQGTSRTPVGPDRLHRRAHRQGAARLGPGRRGHRHRLLLPRRHHRHLRLSGSS